MKPADSAPESPIRHIWYHPSIFRAGVACTLAPFFSIIVLTFSCIFVGVAAGLPHCSYTSFTSTC